MMKKSVLILDTGFFWFQFLRILYPSSEFYLECTIDKGKKTLLCTKIDYIVCPAYEINFFLPLLLQARQIKPGISLLLIGKDRIQLDASKMTTMRCHNLDLEGFITVLTELMQY